MMTVITVQFLVLENLKNTKSKPRYIFKRHFRQFDEQAFLHDLYHTIDRVSLILDVDTAWDYYYMTFMSICDKCASVKKCRISGRDNPWFSENLAELNRKIYVAQARRANAPVDWASFRALRNKCTGLIRKSKSEYYLNTVTENLNNPNKFWKVIKSVSGSNVSSDLPDHLMMDSNEVKDNANIVVFFLTSTSYLLVQFLIMVGPRPLM